MVKRQREGSLSVGVVERAVLGHGVEDVAAASGEADDRGVLLLPWARLRW